LERVLGHPVSNYPAPPRVHEGDQTLDTSRLRP
jgi:hypothetical protein